MNRLFLVSLLANVLILASIFFYVKTNPQFDTFTVSQKEYKRVEKNWGIDIVAIPQEVTEKVIVAVIDTGIDFNNPVFKSHLFVNINEIPDNDIDDDKNGFIDDVNGWDFIDNDNTPNDMHDHGSHIAGIIIENNPNVLILPIKSMSVGASNINNIEKTNKSIEYAVKMGAKIVNYSAGGYGYNKEERDLIFNAQKDNVLFIVSAGNSGLGVDEVDYYPAKYNLDNVIVVGNMNVLNKRDSSSNFGNNVHIFAPGANIVSFNKNGKRIKMSGTSQATAFVSSGAAYIYSQNLDRSYGNIKDNLLKNVILVEDLKNECQNGGYFSFKKEIK